MSATNVRQSNRLRHIWNSPLQQPYKYLSQYLRFCLMGEFIVNNIHQNFQVGDVINIYDKERYQQPTLPEIKVTINKIVDNFIVFSWFVGGHLIEGAINLLDMDGIGLVRTNPTTLSLEYYTGNDFGWVELRRVGDLLTKTNTLSAE